MSLTDEEAIVFGSLTGLIPVESGSHWYHRGAHTTDNDDEAHLFDAFAHKENGGSIYRSSHAALAQTWCKFKGITTDDEGAGAVAGACDE